jgi:hypothetical protein
MVREASALGLCFLAASGCARPIPGSHVAEGAAGGSSDVPGPAWKPAPIPAKQAAPSSSYPGMGSEDLVSPWVPKPPAAAQPAASPLPAALPGPSAHAPSVAPSFPTLPGTLGAWRGGTVIPADAEGATQCTLSSYAAPGRMVGYCAKIARGPLVVTELHGPGTCKADLYALGGTLSKPVWIALMPKGLPVHITGASLAVPVGGDLVVGVLGASEASIGHDLSCSVTWSGWAIEARRIIDQPGF